MNKINKVAKKELKDDDVKSKHLEESSENENVVSDQEN